MCRSVPKQWTDFGERACSVTLIHALLITIDRNLSTIFKFQPSNQRSRLESIQMLPNNALETGADMAKKIRISIFPLNFTACVTFNYTENSYRLIFHFHLIKQFDFYFKNTKICHIRSKIYWIRNIGKCSSWLRGRP